MRTTTIFLVGIMVALSATAHEDGQWINLFDGETTFGFIETGDVDWQVQDGVLRGAEGTGGYLATSVPFTDFELDAQVRVKAGSTSGLVVRAPLDGHPTANGAGVIWLETPKNGDEAWRAIHVEARGDKIIATVDGERVDVSSDNAKGRIGLLYHHNGSAWVELKEMKLRPLNLDPLFNGKDLSGWNVLPNHQSKFNVVDGAINITDGNGQIETEGTYKDFVLQLDIISNGEHLNSGVFVRGPVGVFWKGYESQVRNQWASDDRTKPIDYGTGGNYGNQAARKVIPSDGEWFNKTIVIDDNRMAVWINGYLVNDFLDTRPVNKNANAKEGFVPDAGTIHLQGHDPTTNLSFKNILIGEYPNN